MILKNLQKNKAPSQLHFQKSGAGFVMLFAITISAIILVIALGVVNIAFKEVRFSTDARDTNDAFFAADTGLETALFRDIVQNSYQPNSSITFSISQLGSASQSCALVTVAKTAPPVVTTITSKGYNNGGNDTGFCSPTRKSVERELTATY